MELKRNNTGFSLIELSVVMAIIGVTLGGALTLATNVTEANKVDTTEERLDAIEEAIGRYLADNQRMPCPADGSLAFSSANFGVEQIDTGSDPHVCQANFQDASPAGAPVWIGVVPVKTLNLPDEYMIDGWGRKITYAVDDHFANNLTTNSACDDSAGVGSECFTYADDYTNSITIVDTTGVGGSNITTEAVAVLVSHGKNGHGAFLRHGSATRLNAASTDADEQENSEYNASGVPLTYDHIFVQKSQDDTYDDVVRYYLKWQLVDLAGGITNTSLCAAARNVHDNPDPASNAVCTGATNLANCEAMAEKVFDLCLMQ